MDLEHEERLQYDARLYVTMPHAGEHKPIPARGYYGLVSTLALLAPFLLYTKGGQLIKRLQQSRSKAKVPFFWAVASLAHVFNVYMILKLFVATCHPYRPPSWSQISKLHTCEYNFRVCSSHCVHNSMHSQQVHFISNSKNMEFCYKLLQKQKIPSIYNNITLGYIL